MLNEILDELWLSCAAEFLENAATVRIWTLELGFLVRSTGG